MKPLPAIDAVPIFEETQHELISLLKSLSSEEWEYSTSSKKWNVKDVVAHLLDGDLRRLSLHRDKHTLPDPSEPINDYESLVDFLNALNNSWVRTSKRLSPKLLLELTEFTTPKVVGHLKSLDPEGTALFSVGWAGETESENWFDIAREYSEKWHHQQQIREAAGRPLLVQKKWLSPLISTLIRGVPPVYNKHAPDLYSEKLKIYISGVIDESWLLAIENEDWQLFIAENEPTDTLIEMDDDTAWRLFTGNITEDEALSRIKVSGNHELGNLITKTVSYMK
jgi:hypothetical protein